MINKTLKIALAVILPLVIILSSLVTVSAISQHGYIISLYDVDVKIIKDGTLYITEKVKYSYLGNSNNAVILIDKQEDEEIEIVDVYTYKNTEYVKCERLTAGQWDANVFTGTYSEVQESNLLRLKIYGYFAKQQATFIVRYKVKNSIKRYNDVAEYKRNHVFKNWDGYISSININVWLPKDTNDERIKPFLHGVLVGQKSINERRKINYNIPNTVPGEYVEARIVFPEYLVFDAPVTEEIDYMQTVIQEEKEYAESDKTELLRARENAAKEVGRIAWNEKMRERTKFFFSIVSIIASCLGLLTIFRSEKELKSNKDNEVFELRDIAQISPSEAGLLLKGRTGARAFLAGLLHLVYKGNLKLGISSDEEKDYLCFSIPDEVKTEQLDNVEQHLLCCVKDLSEQTGTFCPEKIPNKSGSPNSVKLDGYIKTWSNSIKRVLKDENKLTPDQLYYRNLGLIMGVVLFSSGCIVPVAFSIWSGYLMLPIGLLLFWYSLNIHKRTRYRMVRLKALKRLRKIIADKNFDISNLPDSIIDSILLLGYGIVLGVENKLSLSKDIIECKNDLDSDRIKEIIKMTVVAIDNSIFSDIDY